MNLALEYLIRSNSIAGLLRLPCSVLFHNKYTGDNLVLLIRREGSNNVELWELSRLAERSFLPVCETHSVPREDFHHILPTLIATDFRMFPYLDDPIPSGRNSYNHPMSQNDYWLYASHFLNSFRHTFTKRSILWTSFLKVHFPDILKWRGEGENITNPFYNQECRIAEESLVREHYKLKWHYWSMWLEQFLPLTPVAGELYFISTFPVASEFCIS